MTDVKRRGLQLSRCLGVLRCGNAALEATIQKKHSCTKISLDLQTNFGFCVDVISFHGVNIASLADLHSA
jgi:hypothetical protein